MNAKVLKAINNLKDVLAQEMEFHPQTISLCSFDHYEETSDPNIALDLTVKHGFKSNEMGNGSHVVKLDYQIPGSSTIVEMRHYFDKAEEYTEDDLPNYDEAEEIIYDEEKEDRKHQEYEYRESKI